jgi:hypothetical protein
VQRNFRITETVGLRLRCEFFNIRSAHVTTPAAPQHLRRPRPDAPPGARSWSAAAATAPAADAARRGRCYDSCPVVGASARHDTGSARRPSAARGPLLFRCAWPPRSPERAHVHSPVLLASHSRRPPRRPPPAPAAGASQLSRQPRPKAANSEVADNRRWVSPPRPALSSINGVRSHYKFRLWTRIPL